MIESVDEALFYVSKMIDNGWSRNVLMNMMEAVLYHAKGRAITNFAEKLPPEGSELAQQTLKNLGEYTDKIVIQHYNMVDN